LSLYTYQGCFEKINSLLRETKTKEQNHQKILEEHVVFTLCFIKGFRSLPSYWGRCYRGVVLDPTQNLDTVNGIFVWKSFTSASKVMEKAINFIDSDKIQEKIKGLLFIIKSRSGRCLSELSCYPSEEEIVFRPYTSFKIKKIIIKDVLQGNRTLQDVYHIWVTEIYPDIRGRKVLVWIDDRIEKAAEFHSIMDNSENVGVTCVHLHSTKVAKEFFETHSEILNRDIESLRIITDMVRTEEDKKLNIEAGLELTKLLRDTFKYSKSILCYTGPRYLENNRKKFQQHNMINVYATATRQDAEEWARFRSLPDAMKP